MTDHEPRQSLWVGGLIRERLAYLGRAHYELADELGVHASIVGLWAGGHRPVPSYRVDALARALDVAVDEMAQRAGVPPGRAVRVAVAAEVVAPPVRSMGLERIAAYTLAPFFGPSPVPGRPRGTAA